MTPQLPPEGISQSAWDEAVKLASAVSIHGSDTDRIATLARAIMAATERAALIADEIGRSYGDDETGWLGCSETIAAAIRQGSQPSNAIPLKGVVR